MRGEAVVFWLVVGSVVSVPLMVLLPCSAGRRPLALYDQLCSYAALFGVAFVSVDLQGERLWMAGLCAAVCGALAGKLLDMVFRPGVASSWMGTITYVAGAAVCFLFPLAGGRLGEWLLDRTASSAT